MEETRDESTASFIQAQLHSVIASQRTTIESLRDSIARSYVPRVDYDELLARCEESDARAADTEARLEASLAHGTDLQNQLDSANALSTRLQEELDGVHTKLTSTYAVLNDASAKIDIERAEFDKSLKKIRRSTVDEIRKNSELHEKTVAMEQTFLAQQLALETKTNELKQLEKRFSRQEERASNEMSKLVVKLEQEKFISREIVQTGTNQTPKSKIKK